MAENRDEVKRQRTIQVDDLTNIEVRELNRISKALGLRRSRFVAQIIREGMLRYKRDMDHIGATVTPSPDAGVWTGHVTKPTTTEVRHND